MRKTRLLWLFLALLMSCGVCAAGGRWLLRPAGTPAAPPRVVLESSAGTQAVPVGQPVEVRGGAYSTAPQGQIVRLILWIDGQVVGEAAGPANPLTNAWQWTPATPGSHTLTLEAVDTAGRRNAAYGLVEVQPAADDPDRDGLPNDQDACPDQPGPPAQNGCPTRLPDADGDGIPDGQDACPDQAGVPENQGCPLAAPGDTDGDGTPDDQDQCPQSPGPAEGRGCPLPPDADGDGTPDANDPCPNAFGPHGGCPPAPDADGDGTPDDLDQCPDQPGPAGLAGCPLPDADGDGLPDDLDQCPDQAGPAEDQGCPTPQATDADGDGTPDAADACPNHPGPADNQGCPVADADGDGTPDDLDQCPDQAGPADHQGCPRPDADGDGTPDDLDQCPDQPGPPQTQGCPLTDRDGDGIPNGVDRCPDLAGDAANQGCPPWVAGLEDAALQDLLDTQARVCRFFPSLCNLQTDADGDGVPDGQDACPDQPGLALNRGCPWAPGDLGVRFDCPRWLPEFLCQPLQRDVQRAWQRGWEEVGHQPPPPGWEFLQGRVAAEPPDAARLKLQTATTNDAWLEFECEIRLDDRPWISSEWVTTDQGTHWQPADPDRWDVLIEEPNPNGLNLRMLCWGWRDFTEGLTFLGRVRLPYMWQGTPSRTFHLTSYDGERGYNFTVDFVICEDPAACP